MSTSNKVKAVLAYYDKKQVELAEHFGMGRQTLNNKINRDSWSAKDLAQVAAFVGCKVGFILPDGQYILLDDPEDPSAEKNAPGE